MPTITTKDGTTIFYKDWGKGQPIVFSHGWPLSGDDWDTQMLFFGQHGYRVIAHDRRGHGRSAQTWDGNDMDTYADDLAALFEELDLKNAIMVGHSTGGGEVARYLGRHGTERVAKAVLISAVPPLMLKTEKNSGGLPLSVFDSIRAGVAGNRSQFYKDITLPFYGYNRPGAKISEGIREHWWLEGMMGGVKAHYDCIKAFSETDFTEDLKRIGIPMLVGSPDIGDDGQVYNTAFLVGKDGQIRGRYDKRHLVPFGEYVPLHQIFFFLDKLAVGIGELGRGQQASVFSLDGSRFSVAICYEVIFPGEVREFVRNGAGFLVNITNDAWFGRSGAPAQHLAMAAMRAVENGTYLIRAANTGITAIIAPTGQILAHTDIFTEAILSGTIQARQGETPYTRYGDVLAWVALVFLAAYVLALVRAGWNNRMKH